MLTSSEATALISDYYDQWITAIRDHNYDWLERHLAEDFLFTAHPFPKLKIGKRQFINVDKEIDNAEINFIVIRAEAAGDIIVSRAVADVKEDFKADLGPGMPTASEVTGTISGQRVAYCSGWRNNGKIWQCFDHHLIGVVSRE